MIRKGYKSDRRLRHLVEAGKWREDELAWLLRQPGLSDGLAWAVRRKLAEVRATTGIHDIERGGVHEPEG